MCRHCVTLQTTLQSVAIMLHDVHCWTRFTQHFCLFFSFCLSFFVPSVFGFATSDLHEMHRALRMGGGALGRGGAFVPMTARRRQWLGIDHGPDRGVFSPDGCPVASVLVGGHWRLSKARFPQRLPVLFETLCGLHWPRRARQDQLGKRSDLNPYQHRNLWSPHEAGGASMACE